MPEEPVVNPAVETPVGEPVAEGTEGTLEGTESTLSEEQIAALLSSRPELIEQALAKLPDEKVKGLPQVERRISQFVTAKQKELAEQQRTAMETARRASEEHSRNLAWAQDLLTRVASSTGPQILQHAQQNPNIYSDIDRAQRIVASGNNPAAFSREEYAREAYAKVKDRLKTKYADVDYDAAKEIEDLIEMATEANVDARTKAVREDITKEMDAKFTELKNALHLSSDQPDRLPPSTSGGAVVVRSADDAHVAYVEGKFGSPGSPAARKTYRDQLARFGDKPDL